ncbi:hypothetical protein [Pantoea sp. BAV 3049]|uniref:hypothetical protein n=1 Tax=Pantoea sp. BAV 3049 TaxID=2654188 RepID=UPI0018EF1370|nr:hypothetical protein [Pantoea sp. BAV 3049]
MVYRFTLAAITAALTLTGCAKILPTGDRPAAQTGEKPVEQATQPAVNNFTTGPAQVTISHAISRTDDGSTINVTIDGDDAGPLVRGQTTDLHLTPGKHKVGGYVSTLYGYGRVTIPSVEITATQKTVQHVTYSMKNNKPTFAAGKATPVPVTPAPVAETTLAVPAPAITPVANAATTTSTTPATTAATTTSATPANSSSTTSTTAESTSSTTPAGKTTGTEPAASTDTSATKSTDSDSAASTSQAASSATSTEDNQG